MMLEHRLQIQLFNRTTRSVRLTNAGRMLLERFERIVQDRDEAFELVGDQAALQGELRVTCSTAMGERFVAPLIRQFAAPFPKLTITINLSNSIIDLASEGYDLAVRTGSVTDPRLVATQVASRRLRTCAASGYLARAGVPSTPDDLSGHECLIGSSSTWHYRDGDREIVLRPKSRFRCNSGAAVLEASLAGFGICQLPDFYIAPHLRTGALKPVLEPYQPADEPVWAVYPRRRYLSPKISRIVDHLSEQLGPAINGASGRI